MRCIHCHSIVSEPHEPNSLNPSDVYKEVAWLGNEPQENFIAVFYDSKMQVISMKTLHIGTLNASLVHPRDLFREAVKVNAHAVIIAHNHPSGDASPSDADRTTTSELVKCGKMIGIQVIDHLIVAGETYNSLRETEAALFITGPPKWSY